MFLYGSNARSNLLTASCSSLSFGATFLLQCSSDLLFHPFLSLPVLSFVSIRWRARLFDVLVSVCVDVFTQISINDSFRMHIFKGQYDSSREESRRILIK